MKKIFLGITTYLLLPLVTLVVIGGLMQGSWFDVENLMERPDIEVYETPRWQHFVYYATCLLLIASECLVFRLFLKSTTRRRLLYWGLFIVIMTFILLLMFSIRR